MNSNHRLKPLILIVILCCSAFAKAQLESSQWFFGGNAGIDFRSGTVAATSDSGMKTGEGCSALSDADGNLLFYTDGSTIYNRNHQVMLNGTGLKGNSSSTSSAVVIPLPNSANRFYVFTVDTDDLVYRNSEGMHYSIVDMALDNGAGAVENDSKNTQILARTSEKLTAIENDSATGYWVITQFEDKFYSYELTGSGLNMKPVISQVDPFIELLDYFITNVDVSAMRGYIKVNTSGDKIAAAHFSNNSIEDFDTVTSVLEARSISYTQGGELYLYDFDNSTGIVSKPIPLLTKEDGGSFYGIEFSPNGQYLYAEIDYLTASQSSIFNFLGGEIAQFDLTTSDIPSSKRTIYQDNFLLFRGAMQLGIDGKIYHSRLGLPALSVLSNPNDREVPVNYVYSEFALATGTEAFYGLPIFVQSFFTEFKIRVSNGCEGDEILFTLETNTDDYQVTWHFDDPDSGIYNNSTEKNATHVYPTAGNYEITAIVETLFQQIRLKEAVDIFPQVQINEIIDKITECELGFNRATFDLSKVPDLISSVEGQNVAVYASESDALNGLDSINTSIPYDSSSSMIFIRVENENCFQILELALKVEKCDIEVFNVITPNGDGDNDVLNINGLRNIYDNFQISIFNRYGRLVWDGGAKTSDWDGTSNKVNGNKLLPSGTYYYIIELSDPGVDNKSGYIYLTY
jgi:gliding motility-associated-like protein